MTIIADMVPPISHWPEAEAPLSRPIAGVFGSCLTMKEGRWLRKPEILPGLAKRMQTDNCQPRYAQGSSA